MNEATALRLPVLIVLAAMLWSCGTARSSWYQSPPGLTGATGATVSMSDNPPSGGDPDGDTRVVTVDGQPVFALDFDKIVLPPGQHTLGVEYNGAVAYATVPLQATLRAGTSYLAKGQRSAPCDAAVWLQDQSTGQPFGDKLPAHLITKPSVSGAPIFAAACN